MVRPVDLSLECLLRYHFEGALVTTSFADKSPYPQRPPTHSDHHEVERTEGVVVAGVSRS